MKMNPRNWYCYVCGKALEDKFVISSMSDHTDRVFLAHNDCSKQLDQNEVYICTVMELPQKLVGYNTGDPIEDGVYACRIPHPVAEKLLADIFLLWHGARWCYIGSDQFYRDKVFGWIGPLQRKMA